MVSRKNNLLSEEKNLLSDQEYLIVTFQTEQIKSQKESILFSTEWPGK